MDTCFYVREWCRCDRKHPLSLETAERAIRRVRIEELRAELAGLEKQEATDDGEWGT